jgi:hypothetical protein
MYFAHVPLGHLVNLIEDNNFLKLINHDGYNPRIIETVINAKIWESSPPKDFVKNIKSYFDNPISVWQTTFENTLDEFSRNLMFVLLTLGNRVLIDDLELSFKEFLSLVMKSIIYVLILQISQNL